MRDVLPNPDKSNKVKLIISFFVIGILILPLGWKFSTILAGDSAEPDFATLMALDPPAEFDAVAKSMGFVLSERVQITELDRATISIRAPEGISGEEAYDLLSKRFPNVVIIVGSSGLNDMNTASGVSP